MPRRLTKDEVVEQFHRNIEYEPNSGCWLWSGVLMGSGYGQMGNGASAHRYSWKLHFGEIPRGLCVCHTCDVRPCCNPAHLFLGTHAENMADRNRKGRARGGPSGARHRSAKLTEDQVRDIRRRLASESGSALAREFGVSANNIWEIKHGISWRHVA